MTKYYLIIIEYNNILYFYFQKWLSWKLKKIRLSIFFVSDYFRLMLPQIYMHFDMK